MDPNLPDIANFLSAQLGSAENFYKFGEKLVGKSKRADVMNIKNHESRVDTMCLRLIKLWISNVKDAEWRDLVKAASDSDFHGLAGTLAKELGSPKEPPRENVQKSDMQSPYGGKYQH